MRPQLISGDQIIPQNRWQLLSRPLNFHSSLLVHGPKLRAEYGLKEEVRNGEERQREEKGEEGRKEDTERACPQLSVQPQVKGSLPVRNYIQLRITEVTLKHARVHFCFSHT